MAEERLAVRDIRERVGTGPRLLAVRVGAGEQGGDGDVLIVRTDDRRGRGDEGGGVEQPRHDAVVEVGVHGWRKPGAAAAARAV